MSYKVLFSRSLILSLLLFTSIVSCTSKKESGPKVTGSVIVSSEGAFGNDNSNVTFFNPTARDVQQNVYTTKNGFNVGGIIQHIYINGSNAYITVQSSGGSNDKVEVVNNSDFSKVTAITGSVSLKFSIPRFSVALNSKLYVTNWGAYDASFNNPNSFIGVVDLASNTLTKKIDVSSRPEGIVVANNKVYVANRRGNVVTVINPSTDAVETTISVSNGPAQMVLDKDQKIWVICTSGSLVKINPSSNTIEQTLNIPGDKPNGLLSISPNKSRLYYVTSQSFPSTISNVFYNDINTSTLTQFISKNNIYGFGVDPNDGTIYVGISPSFSGNGTFVRFLVDGTEVDNYAAGIGPNGFLFK